VGGIFNSGEEKYSAENILEFFGKWKAGAAYRPSQEEKACRSAAFVGEYDRKSAF